MKEQEQGLLVPRHLLRVRAWTRRRRGQALDATGVVAEMMRIRKTCVVACSRVVLGLRRVDAW